MNFFSEQTFYIPLRPWSFRNNVHNDQGKRRATSVARFIFCRKKYFVIKLISEVYYFGETKEP